MMDGSEEPELLGEEEAFQEIGAPPEEEKEVGAEGEASGFQLIELIHKYPNENKPIHEDLDFDHVDFVDSCIDFDLEGEASKTIESGPRLGFDRIEYTLAMVKPGAMGSKREIVRRIKDEGYRIIGAKILKLTPEVASDFFEEHYGKMWFPTFILKMSEGPVLVLALAKENGVEDFKDLMGPERVSEARTSYPKSLRGLYGMKGDLAMNAIHGSKTHEDAQREINFFFKDIEYLPKASAKSDVDYIKRTLNPLVFEGLLLLVEERPQDPVRWLADWLLQNNPNKPKMPIHIQRMPSKY